MSAGIEMEYNILKSEFESQAKHAKHLEIQIKLLAEFILAEVPNEPSVNDGACATAIRIIRSLQSKQSASLLVDEGWVSVAERLPESGRDVLLWLVATPEPEVKIKTHIIGLAVGHLDRAAAGNIIMRPLMIKGEHVRQWPAWAIAGDEEDYHEASHWQDTKLPTPPSERKSE